MIRRIANRLQARRLIVELLEDRCVPATFVVNELMDTAAVNLIAGTDANGLISLRSAIQAADNLGGDQTIQFDPSVFAAPQTILLTRGVLDLKKTGPGAITILGPDVGVTISGNHKSEVFRVESGTTADLNHLTISAGKVIGNGGGIGNNGTLNINNCTISNNAAIIYHYYVSGVGGGIYCYYGSGGGISNNGSLTLVDSVVSGNTAQKNGGGIYNTLKGKVNLTDCTVSGNTLTRSPYNYWGYGGGIDNLGAATLTKTTISGNSSTCDGGGIYNTGTATLLECTISRNTAPSFGGGVLGIEGATTTLDRCTVSNNSASSGGGIAIPTPESDDEPLTLLNSTVSGNTAADRGGGIYLGWDNEATLINSTISGNTATEGGGIYNDYCDLTLKNTIVAGNLSKSGDGDLVGVVLPSSVNNLIGDGRGITGGMHNNVKGNLIGTHAAPINPLLGPLGYYGGPTQTMPLLPGSPAIDAGSNAALPSGVTTDQNGQPRIVDGTVDIGAVESPRAFLPPPTGITPSSAVAVGLGYDVLTFGWNAVAEADHYDLVVVDNNTGMTAIAVPGITGTAYAASATQALTPGHSFTTYVFAFNADNTEYGGAAQTFALAALPAPTGITPSGMVAASAGYDKPTFTWSAAGADHFTLKVVDNTTHTTPMVVTNISSASYATPAAQALTPGHSFTIYVTALSTNGQAKALATQSFTLAALSAPTGITPNGVVTASAGFDLPTFNWNTVAGADHYTLAVVDNSTGATPIIVRNLVGTSYAATIAQALTPGHRFTIRVTAFSTNGKAYRTGVQSFSLAALSAPTLLAPIGSVASPSSFTWTAVTGADRYNLYLKDGTTGAVVKYVNITTNAFSPSVPLSAGHKYIWWVAAVSTNNLFMARSTPQIFTINTSGGPL